MELKVNQKVLVTKMIRNDGTCAGCKRGTPVAYEGMEGFICEITEFHFEPVYVVHFLDINKKLGFRAQELEVIEDFDEEEGKWTVLERKTA
ncbi:nitrogen fixation protein NifZ [Seleniivibrio woodruffii]|uniref:nitrogen fixation protein NifZ n=1 Tax=Seleniivibrio woodruffii TaxID=1078050 RepID=UPI0026EBDC8B|nr:nitrogen fixation protein NifZ [Seleniivibrio woodruffii]